METQPWRPGDRAGAASAPPARCVDRLAGHSRRRRRGPIEQDGHAAVPGQPVRRRRRRVLRGLLQRHAVAAVSRRDRQARSTTASGGTRYVEVNRRFAEATAKAAAEGATVWVQDYQLQLVPKMLRMLRPDLTHRLLPAHPVPAGRAVHADALAHRDHRGSARRRPRRLPPARRRAELPHPGPPAGGRQHVACHGRCAVPLRRGPRRLPHRQGRRLPHLHRLAELDQQARTQAIRQRAREIRASSATRARSCSASTGSTTPRASTFG